MRKNMARAKLMGLGQDIICPGGGYSDPITGICPGDVPYDPGGGTTDGWWNWDAFLRAIQIGGQTAIQVVQAQNSYYRTPYGNYPYGQGPYPGMNYQMAQQAAISYQGSAGISSSTLMTVGIIAAGLIVVMMMMRR